MPLVPLNVQVEALELDLASLANVQRVIETMRVLPDIDILICNAGVMCPAERTLSDDGFELQLAVRPECHVTIQAWFESHGADCNMCDPVSTVDDSMARMLRWHYPVNNVYMPVQSRRSNIR